MTIRGPSNHFRTSRLLLIEALLKLIKVGRGQLDRSPVWLGVDFSLQKRQNGQVAMQVKATLRFGEDSVFIFYKGDFGRYERSDGDSEDDHLSPDKGLFATQWLLR
jgi:hypothetical protein